MIPKCFEIKVYTSEDGVRYQSGTNSLAHLKPGKHDHVSISIEHTEHNQVPSFHDEDEFDDNRKVRHTISFDRKTYSMPPYDEWHYKNCMMGGSYSDVDNKLHDELTLLSRARYVPGLEKFIHELLNRLCPGPDQIQSIANQMDH